MIFAKVKRKILEPLSKLHSEIATFRLEFQELFEKCLYCKVHLCYSSRALRKKLFECRSSVADALTRRLPDCVFEEHVRSIDLQLSTGAAYERSNFMKPDNRQPALLCKCLTSKLSVILTTNISN